MGFIELVAANEEAALMLAGFAFGGTPAAGLALVKIRKAKHMLDIFVEAAHAPDVDGAAVARVIASKKSEKMAKHIDLQIVKYQAMQQLEKEAEVDDV